MEMIVRLYVSLQWWCSYAGSIILFNANGKTSAVLAQMREKGVPFISVLTDPTLGGVSASFAMLGDLNIAEPKALIGFAGPRVIEQTVREKIARRFPT